MSNQFILINSVESGSLEAIAVDDIYRITPQLGGDTDDVRIYLNVGPNADAVYRTVADISLFDFLTKTRLGGFRRA